MNHLALGPKKKRKLKEEDPKDQESPPEEKQESLANTSSVQIQKIQILQ